MSGRNHHALHLARDRRSGPLVEEPGPDRPPRHLNRAHTYARDMARTHAAVGVAVLVAVLLAVVIAEPDPPVRARLVPLPATPPTTVDARS